MEGGILSILIGYDPQPDHNPLITADAYLGLM
jgi:hypothetical protein